MANLKLRIKKTILKILRPPTNGGRLSLGFAACYRRDARKQGAKTEPLSG